MLVSFTKKLTQSIWENGTINIVCLGDSITQGAFKDGFDFTKAYPQKLKELLHIFYPNQVFNIINSGLGGSSAEMAVRRFDRDVLSYNPDLVIIMFGVNDFSSCELYKNSLEKMFTRLNDLEIPCLYVTENMMNTYLPENTTIDYAEKTMIAQIDGTMDEIFASGIQVAKKCSIAVCDVYSKWKKLYGHGVDTTKLLANGINHPIPEMHLMLAYEILSTLLF